jgi:hypothetical protein
MNAFERIRQYNKRKAYRIEVLNDLVRCRSDKQSPCDALESAPVLGDRKLDDPLAPASQAGALNCASQRNGFDGGRRSLDPEDRDRSQAANHNFPRVYSCSHLK